MKIFSDILYSYFALIIIFSINSCGVKNEDLLSQIKNKKIITVYTVCPHKNGERIQDQYLFKIKNDRITLTEKHGSRILNKVTSDMSVASKLEDFIIKSSEEGEKENTCEYFVKCGIQECNIFPDSEELHSLSQLIKSFEDPS
ncbi:MAG: hypothetical protein ACI8XB_002732 [Patiriisocius sp.]|jgi:hypothetical protein